MELGCSSPDIQLAWMSLALSCHETNPRPGWWQSLVPSYSYMLAALCQLPGVARLASRLPSGSQSWQAGTPGPSQDACCVAGYGSANAIGEGAGVP